jgi:nitrogen fixation protein FixH
MSRAQVPIAAALVAVCFSVLACRDTEQPATTGAAGGAASTTQTAAATGTVSSEGIAIAFKSNPDPPRSGDNSIEVTVTDRTGAPVADATVEATFLMPPMPSMSMPAMRSNVTLTHQGGGHYTGTGQLSMAGTWTTTITVMRGGQQVARKTFSVNAG